MFIPHKVYKHDKIVDVAFMVLDVVDTPLNDAVQLKGLWMRITSMGKLHSLADNDTITVKHKDIDLWRPYDHATTTPDPIA